MNTYIVQALKSGQAVRISNFHDSYSAAMDFAIDDELDVEDMKGGESGNDLWQIAVIDEDGDEIQVVEHCVGNELQIIGADGKIYDRSSVDLCGDRR